MCSRHRGSRAKPEGWQSRERDEANERARPCGRVLAARTVLVVVMLIGVTHRTILFYAHRAELDALSLANPTWYTFQHLPLELLRDRLSEALFYLQQTPPVSNLLMAVVSKVFAWPTGVARALIALQGLISVATALMLVRILLALYPSRRLVGALVGIAFVLNTDLVVLEYNSLGQTFYENLSMLFATLAAGAFLRLHQSGHVRWSAAAGTMTAILALTRATWSFFTLPGLLLTLGLVRRRQSLHAAAFLLPVVLLHGGWALKNWVAWGTFSWSTTTWTGYNLTRNLGTDMSSFIAARDFGYCPSPALKPLGFSGPRALPPEVGEWDTAVQLRLGGRNPLLNTLAVRYVSADCQRAFLAFALTSPRKVLDKTWRAYEIFWIPPASYGRHFHFAALFGVSNRTPSGLRLGRLLRLTLSGELPDSQCVMSGTYPHGSFTPTSLYTLRWLEPWILMLNVLGVHVLAPLVAVVALVLRARGGSKFLAADAHSRLAFLAICVTFTSYLAVVSSVGELGENMRFRIGGEPLIWLITILSATELTRLVYGRMSHVAQES